MWGQLGPKYKTEWNLRPPQLLQQDDPTWQEYRKQIEAKMEFFYYNVALTLYEIPEWAKTDKEKRMAMYPLSKRIDAVGYDGENYHLYEVNRNAKLRSVGQAITYRILWNTLSSLLKTKPTTLTYIITSQPDEDVIHVCEKMNIIYEKV